MKWSQAGFGLVLLKRDSQKTMQGLPSIYYAQVIFETFRYCSSFIIVILECLLIECFISQKEDLNENSIFTMDALQIHAKSVPVITSEYTLGWYFYSDRSAYMSLFQKMWG